MAMCGEVKMRGSAKGRKSVRQLAQEKKGSAAKKEKCAAVAQ